jgi:hypothetical protein
MGQKDEALDDAERFLKEFGAQSPSVAAELLLMVARVFTDAGTPDALAKARTTLNGHMPIFDAASPDVSLEAHAVLGRTLAKLADAGAGAEYAKVVAAWGQPTAGAAGGEAAILAIANGSRDEGDSARTLRVIRALDAVGEALVAQADAQRAAIGAQMPAYKGDGSDADVDAFIKNKVTPWMTETGAALEKIDAAYRTVSFLTPAHGGVTPFRAPPRWVIAAAARAGAMWSDFVDSFRLAPIPDRMKNDKELSAKYFDSLDKVSMPVRDAKAKPAFATCVQQSSELLYWDASSRACADWLTKHYDAQFRPIAEFVPRYDRAPALLDEWPAPWILAGAPFHDLGGGR